MYHTRTLFVLLIVAVMLPISVIAQDAPSPNPVATSVIQQAHVDHEGVQFTFDTQLAGSIGVTDYLASNGDAQIPSPAYTEFTFNDYLPGEYLLYAPMPRIDIYNTADFGAYPYFVSQLEALSQLLAERPDLSQNTPVDLENFGANALPFLPIVPAAQVFHPHTQYIKVAGLEGVRYLVYYSQAMNPIIAGEVFYTFQGITDDGQHYVSMMLPVDTRTLSVQMPAIEDNDAWAAEYSQYLTDVVDGLNQAEPQSFAPSMSMLDGLVESIIVSR